MSSKLSQSLSKNRSNNHSKKNSEILEQEKSLETIDVADQSERKIQDMTNSAIQKMLEDVPLTHRDEPQSKDI